MGLGRRPEPGLSVNHACAWEISSKLPFPKPFPQVNCPSSRVRGTLAYLTTF